MRSSTSKDGHTRDVASGLSQARDDQAGRGANANRERRDLGSGALARSYKKKQRGGRAARLGSEIPVSLLDRRSCFALDRAPTGTQRRLFIDY